MPRTFSVEHSKSNRAKCKYKKCSTKIAKDVLRMGAHTEGSDEYPAMTKWYHLKCFKKTIRKGPPTKEDIKGFADLNATEKKRVLKYVFSKPNEWSDSDSDSDSEPILKKNKKRKLSADSSDDEPPKKKVRLNTQTIESMTVTELKQKCKELSLKQSGKKAEIRERLKEYIIERKEKAQNRKKKKTKTVIAEQKRFAELQSELEGRTVKAMKEMLSKNGVSQSGNKSEIISRVIDCIMYGTYPSCPKCYGGRLKVEYDSDSEFGHDGQGKWTCKGFMDDDKWHHCGFTSKRGQTFDRKKWVD